MSGSFDIYKPGVKFSLNVKWWGLSANGNMEIIGKKKVNGQDTVLVRSQVSEIGGFLSFIIKFMRIYKESDTFDSYIDPVTTLPVRYDVYKMMKDGTSFRPDKKKFTECVYFDRKQRRVVSLDDNSTVINGTAPDIQDIYSFFLAFIQKLSNENLNIGKCITSNVYIYRESNKISIRVAGQKVVDGHKVYILKIDRLPPVFKYPASMSFEVVELGDMRIPVKGAMHY
ncbi:MAG: DUF3108 domain-containing protein [Candidatus Poribacteria bacterium]